MARVRSLIRGAATGVVGGVIVFAVVLLSGLAVSGSRLVFLVGAMAGALFGLIPKGDRRFETVGALVVGVAGLASGLVSGSGWLEYSVVLGSALGALWLYTGERMPTGHWAWFRWGGVVLVLLVFVLLPLIVDGGTLGHDESAYTVKAKSWLEGTPDTGWAPHRGTGMSVYGYLVLKTGAVEPGLRMIGLVGVLGLAAGVWALGRLLGNPRVAALAATAVVAGPSMLRRATEYLSDIPAAALLVWCMVIVWREFGIRDRPSYRLLWLLPFAWTAFYLRYQSILSLALIAVVVLVLWWRKVRERPGPVVAVVLIGIIGLIPHLIQAVDLTGKPWGILTYTGGIAERAYVGQGLVDYANQLPWSLSGLIGPFAILASLVGLVASWKDRDRRRPYLFLLVPALLQVLALGLLSHGEPRFVFFPLALTFVAAAIAVDSWVSESRRSWAPSVAIGLAVILIGSLALSAATVRGSVDYRASVNAPMEAAGLAVAADAEGASCGVLTSYGPQVTFYSECATDIFRSWLDPVEAVDRLQGQDRFMVLVEPGKRQPVEEDLEGLVNLTTGRPTFIDGDRVDAYVYAFAD